MDRAILVSLKMILNREKEYGCIKETTSLRVLGRKTKKKDLESSIFLMVLLRIDNITIIWRSI